MTNSGIPKHIAIVMDGNGRWASSRGLPRWEGHREGAKQVRGIVRECEKIGVKALTLYAFSEQNWGRPKEEVNLLMSLLSEFIEGEREDLLEQGIRVLTIGDPSRLPLSTRTSLESLVHDSADNEGLILCLALSYGAREELVHATRAIAKSVAKGELLPGDITAQTIDSNLQTHPIPWELDLVIRTSGEFRLSNFLLWQSAYAEFYFTNVPWPDFEVENLHEAIETYSIRQRRFGLVAPQGQK